MAVPIAIGMVDALVSNTSRCLSGDSIPMIFGIVPVSPDRYRDRPWVQTRWSKTPPNAYREIASR